MSENQLPASPGPLDADVRPLRDALRDRYILEEIIGTGGMGVVWKARDVRHARTVAIKVMRPDIARAVGADRFQREVQIAARLMHPSIVTVIDSGEEAGTLYFVMSYVEGESLRSRLAREGALPVKDAIRIATQLADALRHAHSAGIVHRDIKPENILLSDGHAWLVDFGVARAVATAADARLTSTGLIVGSPQYVSPEQARGEDQIDGRADIYSLGCVLYEMLTGRPPFEAKTLEAMLLGHMTKEPAPLRATRSEIPPHVEKAVLVALAKDPSHRYQTGESFADALAGKAVHTRSAPVVSRKTLVIAASLLLVVSALVLGRHRIGDAVSALAGGGAQLDTTRYVVLPFTKPANLADLGIEQRLSDALAAWQGVDVVEQSRIAEVQASLGPAGSATAARKAAKRFHAGRVVTGSIAQVGDSLRLFVELGDGGRRPVSLAKARLTMPAGSTDHVVSALEAALLFPGVAPECLAGQIGTSVKAAVHDCDRAFSALNDGEISLGDSLFTHALRLDAKYARAALWLSHMKSWLVRTPPDVSGLLSVAIAGQSSLSTREKYLLDGLQKVTAGDFESACDEFEKVVAADSLDYVGWIGLGECRWRDRVVLRNPSSPSGWSFRSSYHAAVAAYRRAFELKPMLIGGYQQRSFSIIRRLLLTGTSAMLTGVAAFPDTGSFMSDATIVRDSLSFIPYRTTDVGYLRNNPDGRLTASAADHQRDMFRSIARRWNATSPNDPRAAMAMAVAKELEGDASAVAEVQRARRLVVDTADIVAYGAAEFWLRVKFGIPDNLAELERARLLADSLLLRKPESVSVDDAARLAPIAVMIGKGAVAARLARHVSGSSVDIYQVPMGVLQPARALFVFSALGGPADSLRRLESVIDRAIANGLSAERHVRVRQDLLTQAAMVAFPDYQLGNFEIYGKLGAFTEAEWNFSQHNHEAARQALRNIAAATASIRPAGRTVDALFVEASLWSLLGDRKQAVRTLDPTLEAVRWFAPATLDDIAMAGTLIRAMKLRAQLARESADAATAKRWSAAVDVLWLEADSDLLAHKRPNPEKP